MPIDDTIVSDSSTPDNSQSAFGKFSIFVTKDTNMVLLMEHKPNRSMPKMIGWVASELWGKKLALSLDLYDGEKPNLYQPVSVNGCEIICGGESVAVFHFQTQAKRVANAYNHFAVDMLAVLS